MTNNGLRFGPLLQSDQWTGHSTKVLVHDMRVDLCRRYVFVAKRFLQYANVRAILQEVGCERVPKTMTGDAFRDPGFVACRRDGFLQCCFIDMMPSYFAAARVHFSWQGSSAATAYHSAPNATDLR